MISAIRAKRTRSLTVTAKPHSRVKEPSAENQNSASPQVRSRRSARGALSNTRYSGRRLSHGLNVKKSRGFRASDSTIGGARTSRTNTPAATSQNVFGRARTAAASPRSARPGALTGVVATRRL